MLSTKQSTLTVRGIKVALVRKEIKNLHIGVYPPDGRVRIAVPMHIDDDAARLAVVKKLEWLKKQIAGFDRQQRLPEPEAISGESLYIFGQRARLRVLTTNGKPRVEKPFKSRLELHVPVEYTTEDRLAVIDRWYRGQLRNTAEPIFFHWEQKLGVKANFLGIKRMKTKWGSCNFETRRIWLNMELVKKPVSCLEFIVVHELIHLLEPTHNENFVALMDKHLPNWQNLRDVLNSAPLAHQNWPY
jgi:predicted metal-dependent hydrolase